MLNLSLVRSPWQGPLFVALVLASTSRLGLAASANEAPQKVAAAPADPAPVPVPVPVPPVDDAAARALLAPPSSSEIAAWRSPRNRSADPLVAVGERIAERMGARLAVSQGSVMLRVPKKPGEPQAALGEGSQRAGARAGRHRDPGIAGDFRRGAANPGRPRAPLGLSAPEAKAAERWGYEGAAGPASWARLHPEFAACAAGSRQSPIDIRDGIKVQLEPPTFDYRPSSFQVVDNGHTIQVNLGAGNFIDVMGRRYELQQFHFHRPSEERVDGKVFDMVVHLVHQATDGRVAVVAVLLEQGSAHELVQSVWNNLPLERGEAVAARTLLDPARLLPAEQRYFTYMGSMTTPPCTEGVLWMVMKSPVAISAEQLAVFARLYPMNARPLQKSGGRLIKESD